jgi:hypothetical protein
MYAIVDDRAITFDSRPPTSAMVNAHVGEPGFAVVRFQPDSVTARLAAPGLAYARVVAFVNDDGLVNGMPRNVVGSVLLMILGAAMQPYAGPIVITGCDPLNPVSEMVSLNPDQAAGLRRLHSDLAHVVQTTPVYEDLQSWQAGARRLAWCVREAPPPTLRMLAGDEAAAWMRDRFGGGQ